MRHYEFIVFGELPTLNQIVDANRKNKFMAAKQKEQFDHLVTSTAHDQLAGVQITERSSFVFCWYRATRKTDPDNVTTGAKFILDGLQKAGILESDKWSHASGGIVHQFNIDKLHPRVEVHIFEGMDLELNLEAIINDIEKQTA